jgi:small-conductance mechanosensitive channel
MTDWWSGMSEYLGSETALKWFYAGILIIVGFIVAKLVSSSVAKVTQKNLDTHHRMIAKRGSYYLILVLFFISALRHLGFDLSVLLGAAGILSVAIGFASQTSASNLISGLFLVAERPFSVGDVIKAGDILGEVLSIDLLSVKLRTFDNLYVRIPNETLIKSEVTTLTRFPIRRIDIKVGVAYKEDLKKVRQVLEEVAFKNPLCLEEPKPLYIFLGFGDSSLDLQFSVWGKSENFLVLMNSMKEEIKEAFDNQGIEIPFPQRTLHITGDKEQLPPEALRELSD